MNEDERTGRPAPSRRALSVVRGGADASGTDSPPVARGRSWAGANWSTPAKVGRSGSVRVYRHEDVWVVEADGPLPGLVADVDHAVQTALAELPIGVVCALPNSLGACDEAQMDAVAAIGRHAQAWPEIPVVMACSDDGALRQLEQRPGAQPLRFASSMLQGWAEVMQAPALLQARLSLHAHPAAVGAARRFLAATCRQWEVDACVPTGELVVSELAANAVIHTAGRFEVVLVSDGATMVGIGLRDEARRAPMTGVVDLDSEGGRGLMVVESLADACGALPTGDGGKLVWARVLSDPS